MEFNMENYALYGLSLMDLVMILIQYLVRGFINTLPSMLLQTVIVLSFMQINGTEEFAKDLETWSNELITKIHQVIKHVPWNSCS